METQTIIVTGKIASLPETKKINFFQKQEIEENFVFDTSTIDNQPVKTKLKLSWFSPEEKINIGQVWQFTVRLKKPHNNGNPGSFDYEKYLLQNQIRAVGYIVNGGQNFCVNKESSGYPIGAIRQKLRDTALAALPDKEMLGTIIALILGDQNGITKNQWEVFRNTGTSYLMAIAGLHIGLAALMFYYLIAFIWWLYPKLILIIPLQRAGTIFGLLSAVIYSILSGFSIPTQRALIMLISFASMFILGRQINSSRTFFLALFLVLLIEPLAPLSISFWLSFAAVAFILYINKYRDHRVQNWWQRYWSMQTAVTLGILPFGLLIFGQVSFISLLANLFALPMVCSVVVPLALIGFLFLILKKSCGYIILLLAEKIMMIVWLPLKWLANLHFFNWHHFILDYKIFVFTFIGVILILAPKKFPVKWLGMIYFLPLLLNKPLKPEQGEIWFTLLDVGQGLSALIQTQNHVLLYDTGPKFAETDAGETIITPFLQTSYINLIDTVVISHGDDDHIGGFNSVIKNFKVATIINNTPQMFQQNNAQLCSNAKSWVWDGVNFDFIYPPPKNDSNASDNESSCVLKISNNTNSILVPGDIEKKTEKWLLINNKVILKSSILVAPHHGSASSSTEEFIDAVQPQYVLFATGYLNRFKFPAKSVVTRYLQHNILLLNTADSGAIFFKLSADQSVLDPILYKKIHRHYWNVD